MTRTRSEGVVAGPEEQKQPVEMRLMQTRHRQAQHAQGAGRQRDCRTPAGQPRLLM